MGHEYSGTVLDVGKGVGRSLVGRAVACEPNYGCGKCADCRLSRISQCPKTVRVGGFAERVVLPKQNVHLLPKGLDPGTAALAEPAACCLEGLEMARMPGATVVVIGAASWASHPRPRQAKGAGLAIRPIPSRAAHRARRLGADLTVDPTTKDLAARWTRDPRPGRGHRCEAVGKPSSWRPPRASRSLAASCSSSASLRKEARSLRSLDFHFKELTSPALRPRPPSAACCHSSPGSAPGSS